MRCRCLHAAITVSGVRVPAHRGCDGDLGHNVKNAIQCRHAGKFALYSKDGCLQLEKECLVVSGHYWKKNYTQVKSLEEILTTYCMLFNTLVFE